VVGQPVLLADGSQMTLAQLLTGSSRLAITNLKPNASFFFYDSVVPVSGLPLHYKIQAAANIYFSGNTTIEVAPTTGSSFDFKIYGSYSQILQKHAEQKDELLITFHCEKK
jgi:hypothetical protein